MCIPQDNQQFIDERKTGYPVPGDVDFEEYHGKIRKKEDKKKDDKRRVSSTSVWSGPWKGVSLCMDGICCQTRESVRAGR